MLVIPVYHLRLGGRDSVNCLMGFQSLLLTMSERDDVVWGEGPTLRWELENIICNDGPFANIQPVRVRTQLGNNLLLGFLNRFIISISSLTAAWRQEANGNQSLTKI